jgi:hypothetical protein
MEVLMAIEQSPTPASGRVRVMSVDQSRDEGILAVTFVNGKSYELNVNNLSAAIKVDGLWHGLEQKLRDSAAGVKGNADEAYDLVSAVGNRLVAGEWAKTREGGGGTTSAYWIEAVMRLKGWTDKADAVQRLAGLADEKRDALKKHPQVVAMVAQIKAERAAAELERARASAGEGGSMEDLFAV